MSQSMRDKIVAALSKPSVDDVGEIHGEVFDPWHDVISGISGSYAAQSDALMIGALEAVQNGKTFEFIDRNGFAGEFALYVLAGHGMTEYGTSPRGAWPDPALKDLWPWLIGKWKDYYEIQWGEPYASS